VRDLSRRLALLGRALREAGLPTTLRDEIDAALALSIVDQGDREEVRTTLRIALRIPRPGYALFDAVLPVFFEGAPREAPPRSTVGPRPPADGRRARTVLRWNPDTHAIGVPGTEGDGDVDPLGSSPEARLRRKSFEEAWSDRDLAMMERLLARLARRLATHRSRRLVPARGRGLPDVRASYRRAAASGGELLRLARRARAKTEPRLVFLVDTSGSMDGYHPFVMTLLLSLVRSIPKVQAYAFNTELVPITAALASGKARLALERLARGVPDWSGGTRIGECLDAFARRHLKGVDRRATVVILSDGLDRGDPAVLGTALRAIRAGVRRVLWLNPLMGDERYRPLAGGMEAALPFLDHLAPAHDLASLERLVPRLLG
jgi:uncharacterized protein with von Willebrand factor type A (vWA) domain